VVADMSDRARIPLYVREGAIVPMESAWMIWPSGQESRFVVHDEDGETTEVAVDGPTVKLSRLAAAVKLKVRGSFAAVKVDGVEIDFVVAGDFVEISLPASRAPLTVELVPAV
jgi:hypothetical protein